MPDLSFNPVQIAAAAPAAAGPRAVPGPVPATGFGAALSQVLTGEAAGSALPGAMLPATALESQALADASKAPAADEAIAPPAADPALVALALLNPAAVAAPVVPPKPAEVGVATPAEGAAEDAVTLPQAASHVAGRDPATEKPLHSSLPAAPAPLPEHTDLALPAALSTADRPGSTDTASPATTVDKSAGTTVDKSAAPALPSSASPDQGKAAAMPAATVAPAAPRETVPAATLPAAAATTAAEASSRTIDPTRLPRGKGQAETAQASPAAATGAALPARTAPATDPTLASAAVAVPASAAGEPVPVATRTATPPGDHLARTQRGVLPVPGRTPGNEPSKPGERIGQIDFARLDELVNGRGGFTFDDIRPDTDKTDGTPEVPKPEKPVIPGKPKPEPLPFVGLATGKVATIASGEATATTGMNEAAAAAAAATTMAEAPASASARAQARAGTAEVPMPAAWLAGLARPQAGATPAARPAGRPDQAGAGRMTALDALTAAGSPTTREPAETATLQAQPATGIPGLSAARQFVAHLAVIRDAGQTGERPADAATGGAAAPLTSQNQPLSPLQAQPAAAPAHQPAVPPERLGAEIVRRAAAGETRFEIRLDPADLGRVDVRIEFDARGEAKAHLSVERREAYDVLTRDQRSLERTLREAGFEARDGSVSVSLRQQGDGERHAHHFAGDQRDGGRERQHRGRDDGPALREPEEPLRQVADRYRGRPAGLVDVRI